MFQEIAYAFISNFWQLCILGCSSYTCIKFKILLSQYTVGALQIIFAFDFPTVSFFLERCILIPWVIKPGNTE